jgi:phosphatidylserine/phosphatidylglycerophosphate/cardiolipin synthase-like enzyme
LIDYEYPDIAVGYIMGHNMLDQYWDTDEHHAQPATPKTGRCGPSPWQDISSRITGPLLQDINANFCQAWDQATGQKLTAARKKLGVEGKHALCLGGSSSSRGVMAQVLRTQSQQSKTEIRKLYLQALNNATQYVFVQNQYFRWQEFADTIKQVAIKHQKGGRDGGTHGPIYLFVITNSSDAAVGQGTYSTYQMLDSLGYSDRMPGVKYAETEDKFAALEGPLEGQLGKLQQEEKQMSTQSYDWSQMAGAANYIAELRGQEGVVSGQIGDVRAQRIAFEQEEKQKEANRKSADASKLTSGVELGVLSPGNTPTLKVLICTLVAPDSPPKTTWVPVYVHAKLGIIDDAFTTLGSANINIRSMNVDSEINVALENGQIATDLRRQLWALHTIGRGRDGKPQKDRFSADATGQSDLDSAYTAWCAIATENKQLQEWEECAPCLAR